MRSPRTRDQLPTKLALFLVLYAACEGCQLVPPPIILLDGSANGFTQCQYWPLTTTCVVTDGSKSTRPNARWCVSFVGRAKLCPEKPDGTRNNVYGERSYSYAPKY